METKRLKKILIIEDDEGILLSLEELIQNAGYTVEIAPNGKEALALLRTTLVLPSAILLDLMMPIMDGFDFRTVQLADSNLRHIPVIVMSADGHIEKKIKETLAAAYLKKPLKINSVLDVLQKFCV